MTTENISFKQEIFNVMENKSTSTLGKFFERFLLFTIFVSVFSAIVETLPFFEEDFYIFFYIEVITVGIFIVEYVLRIWTIVLKNKYAGFGGRVNFVFTPLMVFDFLVILPVFFQIFVPTHLINPGVFKFFRLIRILRLMRIGRYSIALHRILNLIKRHKVDLVAIFFLILTVVTVLSSIMFFLEHEAQSDKFSSIPASIWWGVITLSTIGYGDITPVTDMGRIIGAMTALFGVGIFALPTAILGASFYAEIRSKEQRQITELEKKVEELEQKLEFSEKKLERQKKKKQEKKGVLGRIVDSVVG